MNASVALLALVAAAMLQVSMADMPPELMGIVEECKKEYPVSDEEMSGLKTLTIPDSDAGKCFVGCVLEGLGVVKEGKFVKEKAEEHAKKKLEEKPEEVDKHLQLIDKCNDEVASHNNKCETGPKLMECIKTYAPGLGIMLPGSD